MGKESASEIYRIRIQGNLDSKWSEFLANMSIASERTQSGKPIAVLTGLLADQAALRGVLNRIWDLNLAVISVDRIDRHREEA